MPPGDYCCYAYSGIIEVARGVELAKSTDSDEVADALRKNPTYDHYKGKAVVAGLRQQGHAGHVDRQGPGASSRANGACFDIVSRIPANEEYDRTCGEKGFA